MFWIILSRRYGKTVRELQRQLTSAEFTELWAAEQMYPEGPQVDDKRWSMLCYIAACGASQGKGNWRQDMFEFNEPRIEKKSGAELWKKLESRFSR